MDGGWMEMDAAIYPPRAHKGTQVGQKRNSKNGRMGDGFWVKQPYRRAPTRARKSVGEEMGRRRMVDGKERNEGM